MTTAAGVGHDALIAEVAHYKRGLHHCMVPADHWPSVLAKLDSYPAEYIAVFNAGSVRVLASESPYPTSVHVAPGNSLKMILETMLGSPGRQVLSPRWAKLLTGKPPVAQPPSYHRARPGMVGNVSSRQAKG